MKQMLMGVVLAVCAAAQVPEQDTRVNTDAATRYAYGMPQYATRGEWEARRSHLRKQILAAAGLLPVPQRGPVKATVFGKLVHEGYSIEKVALETMPGYYLGGNLYRPVGKSGKFPGILTPHGHWKNGRLENTELASVPGRSINLARQGYVVFAYDMVGYNDTKQTPHAFGSEKEDLWNFNPLALQLWNSMRAVDFLESLPDVDRTKLGATGASGGGTQTFLLAAVDDRIAADVPVNMISGIMQGGSPCENAPGLRHDTFNVEFGAMMAPRPMLMVAATGDWTKNVPKIEYPTIRAIYALFDAAPQVEQVQFDSPHNYHQGSREAMYTFFGKRFLGKDGTVKEEPFEVEKSDELLVWHGRTLPPGAVDFDGTFRDWRAMTAVQTPDREVLRYALSVEMPSVGLGEIAGEKVVIARKGRGDRVTGIYANGVGDPVLVVHPDGAEAARKAAPESGRPVLYLNAWKERRDTGAKFFTTFHRTDAQNRVQDILTALVYLRAKHPGTVEVRGLDKAAVWATYAAAVDGKVRLRASTNEFTGSDEEFVRHFFVPGLQRAGGWKAALALTEQQRVR